MLQIIQMQSDWFTHFTVGISTLNDRTKISFFLYNNGLSIDVDAAVLGGPIYFPLNLILHQVRSIGLKSSSSTVHSSSSPVLLNRLSILHQVRCF